MGDRRNKQISTKQGFVLSNIALLGNTALSIKDIAKKASTSSQNVKKIINILEKKGYVKLEKDKSDGRSLKVTLTENGKLYYEQQSAENEKYLETLFEGFDDDTIAELCSGLKKLMDNVTKG